MGRHVTKQPRRAMAIGVLLLGVPLGLSGCGVIVLGGILGGILATDDDTERVPLEEAAITSVSPRQSAVVGGVRVRIEGQNFERDSVVSFGGLKSPSVTFIDEQTLEAVVPFNDLNQTGDTEPDDAIYGQLGLRVSTRKHGVTDAPFWYLRPRVVQGNSLFGKLEEPRNVQLTGNYFGFAHPLSSFRPTIMFPDGRTQVPLPPESFLGTNLDPDCLVGPCPEQPDQGTLFSVTLPSRADPGFGGLESGPGYRLRLRSVNGIDEVEFGYSPPFPPLDPIAQVCFNEACTDPVGPPEAARVFVRWTEDALHDPDLGPNTGFRTGFDFVHIERDGVPIGFVPGVLQGGLQFFVDRNVQNAAYTYRIIGEYANSKSPAALVRVAVVPEGVPVNLVWNLSATSVPGGIGSASALALYDALSGAGRTPFITGEESIEDDSVLDRLLLDGLIEDTLITFGDGEGFKVPDGPSIEKLIQYYSSQKAKGRKVYFEGRDLPPALSTVPELRRLFELFFDDFDPQSGLRNIESVTSLRALGDPPFQPLLRGGVGGRISGWREADLPAESLEFLLEVTGPGPSGSSELAFVVACRSRATGSVFSILPLSSIAPAEGVDLGETHQQLLSRLLELESSDPGADPEGQLQVETHVHPSAGLVGGQTEAVIIGENMDQAVAVLFGSIPGQIDAVHTTPLALHVLTPPSDLPGSVPVVVVTSPDNGIFVTVPAGTFNFIAQQPTIHEIFQPGEDGRDVILSGSNFTAPPDLTVRIGGRLAKIINFEPGEVEFLAPAGASCGDQEIVLQTSGGRATDLYSYHTPFLGFSQSSLDSQTPFTGVLGGENGNGGEITFSTQELAEVFVNLTTPPGVIGGGLSNWSFSIILEGDAEVVEVSTAETVLDRLVVPDRDFASADIVNQQGDPRGVVSSVDFNSGAVLPVGTYSVLRIVLAPRKGLNSQQVATLSFQDGLDFREASIRNLLRAVGSEESIVPCNLESARIRVRFR